jgi:hypothetical protein
LAVTEYKDYRIETSETAGKWRAVIRRLDGLDVRIGTARYTEWRTIETATEKGAIERAHKLIDTGTVV